MKRLQTILLTLATLLAMSTQAADQTAALSNTKEITINAKQSIFKQEYPKGIKLHLVQQDVEELRISAPENLSNKIKVKTANFKLSVIISAFSEDELMNGKIDIYIATKAAHKLQLVGLIDATLEDYQISHPLEISIQKGAKLRANRIKASDILLDSAYGSELLINNIEATNLECSADFGAHIRLTEASQVDSLTASGSFGGEITAPQLNANLGHFKASFGSVIRANKVDVSDSSTTFGARIELKK